jgi:hypothetical protein
MEIDNATLELLKILGHFILAAFIVITLRIFKVPTFTAVLFAFSLVSIKEVLDMSIIGMIEYDDLAINLAGSVVGSSLL